MFTALNTFCRRQLLSITALCLGCTPLNTRVSQGVSSGDKRAAHTVQPPARRLRRMQHMQTECWGKHIRTKRAFNQRRVALLWHPVRYAFSKVDVHRCSSIADDFHLIKGFVIGYFKTLSLDKTNSNQPGINTEKNF